jgi:hypothetical protein
MSAETVHKIRVREDGLLESVSGDGLVTGDMNRKTIAGRMGWTDSGDAASVITRTLELLARGKAVKLTSHHGYTIMQPLLESEDGRMIPASYYAGIYSPDGELIQRNTRG